MLRITKLLGGIAAAVLALPSAASAQALFDFTFTNANNGNVIGSGTFTTGASNPAGSYFTPSLLITGISGTYRGNAITGLAAAGTFYSNDNILYPSPPPGSSYLDLRGVAFTTAAGTADFYFGLGGPGTIFTNNAGNTTSVLGRLTVTPGVAAVPEAATWAMMIAGFGFVGGAMRYRRKATAVRFA